MVETLSAEDSAVKVKETVGGWPRGDASEQQHCQRNSMAFLSSGVSLPI